MTSHEELNQAKKFRILVIGDSGSGKSKLLNVISNRDITTVSEYDPGIHDINENLLSFGDKVIFHDSQGFQSGRDIDLKVVEDFVDKRLSMESFNEKLHAIWICIPIPSSGDRPLLSGIVSRTIVEKYNNKIPLVIIFTKYDVLYHRLFRENKKNYGELSTDSIKKMCETGSKDVIDRLCVQPLSKIFSHSSGYRWFVTSSHPKFKDVMNKDLVDYVLEITNFDKE